MEGKRRGIKINVKNLWHYFILIPFLHPRGFDEIYPIYKTFFTIWLYTAIAMISVQVLLEIYKGGMRVDTKKLWIGAYFILAVGITAYSRGDFSSGLQVMFASPALCLYFTITLKNNINRILNVLSNILIINFLLNLTIFYPSFINVYHVVFLGHVQVVSQLGLISLFVGGLLYMQDKRYKKKSIALFILSSITMISAGADSAVLSLIIIVVAAIIYKLKLYHLFCFNSKIYVMLLLCASILVVLGTASAKFFINIPNLDYTFNGRNAIWENALKLIKERPILGYGIDGVLIKVYWGSEMNYAHNQFLQNLLDGGVILCMAFYAMLFVYTSYINRIVLKKYIVMTNATLIAFLCVMIFDSTTSYCYMYIFLSILVYLPEIERNQRGHMYGTNSNFNT